MINKRIAKICRIGIMAALFFLLAKLTIHVGNVRVLDFASLPLILTAILFDPVEAICAALLGEFISQLLGYGLTATTVLWILPPAIRALTVGIFVKCSKKHMEERIVYTYIATVVAALITTAANTLVSYIDAVVYKYSYAYVLTELPVRLGTGVLTAIVIASIVIPMCRVLRKHTERLK